MQMAWHKRAAVAEWQERAGVELPSPEWTAVIPRAKQAAVNLLELLILEESGIRDGDSTWHGSDPLQAAFDLLVSCRVELYGPLGATEAATALPPTADAPLSGPPRLVPPGAAASPTLGKPLD
jgi:hypothetical protein